MKALANNRMSSLPQQPPTASYEQRLKDCLGLHRMLIGKTNVTPRNQRILNTTTDLEPELLQWSPNSETGQKLRAHHDSWSGYKCYVDL